jgi:hypothetical protein
VRGRPHIAVVERFDLSHAGTIDAAGSIDGYALEAAVREPVGDPFALGQTGQETVSRPLRIVVEAGEVGHRPVPEHHGREDLIVVNGEVVDAGASDRSGMTREARDAGARHLEADHLPFDRSDHGARIDAQRSSDEIAVEEVVQVLVGGHPFHDPEPGWIADEASRVVMRNARGQFL